MSEQDLAARLERLSDDVRDFTDSMNNEDGYFELADAKLLRDAAAALRRLQGELRIRKAAYEHLNLCSDHRDKAMPGRCIVCDGETRGRQAALSGASAQGPEEK